MDQDATDIGVGSRNTRASSSTRGRRGRFGAITGVALLAIAGVAGIAGLTRSQANESEPETVAPADITDASKGADAGPGGHETATNAASTAVASEPPTVESIMLDDIDERLIIVAAPDELVVLDFAEGTRTLWSAPERMTFEPPVAVDGSVVVVGDSRAWVRSAQVTTQDAAPSQSDIWTDIGAADRVRLSTKRDRVWLRSVNIKTDPTDAEFLWNEVDLAGEVHRTMFRNRPLWFPTPEFILGLGSNVFRFTHAEINPWRLFSPFGVPMAVGPNDLIARECNTRIECGHVWYDLVSGEKRRSIYQDLAGAIDGSYGTLLSPDGRFLISELKRPGASSLAFVRTVVEQRVVANDCLWDTPLAWSQDDEAFVCRSELGVEIHLTAQSGSGGGSGGGPAPAARIAVGSGIDSAEDVAFSFF